MLVPNCFPIRFGDIKKPHKAKSAQENFHLLEICICMISSREEVAWQVMVAVNDPLQILLMLKDCYAFGLKENW